MKGNRVQLIGYVGSDLVVRNFQKTSNVRLRVATHYPHKSPSGTVEWKTVWHDVVAWDRMAKVAECNFVKGSRIMLEGSIHYRSFSDKNGHLRYVTEINANSLLNLDR
ncbi:single-stranded DNA-binding protein [Niabella ginsengisoli]|uniref:Single-stranded DNA-binding protein n=1 Tax=Niabella ginsengisoli TaxID=522298 RepID=A0ABS9SHZ4_9BACT|nr:single-stranded DNA-binding protein [Niabella ginsengisoli]MCH5597988.1 single-stranded DNA-binding protein [Niabella ginsengisoli]